MNHTFQHPVEKEEREKKKNEAKSQVFRAVIDSYPENKFYCRNVNCKWN
jgi:hypothetical protein